MNFTIGCHNLHDETGTATPFASIIGFTEAIPKRVKAELKKQGYKFVAAKRQPDLVLAYDAKLFKKKGLARYKKVVDGVRKVTPNRGTLKVTLALRATGELVDVFLEHRINAAFPPFIRGEAEFRSAKWKAHTAVTLSWIKQSIDKGRKVIAFGDLNTPRGVSGYQLVLVEFGSHFDRIGVYGFAAWGVQVLSKFGSDHNRLRITASPRATVKALFSALYE